MRSSNEKQRVQVSGIFKCIKPPKHIENFLNRIIINELNTDQTTLWVDFRSAQRVKMKLTKIEWQYRFERLLYNYIREILDSEFSINLRNIEVWYYEFPVKQWWPNQFVSRDSLNEFLDLIEDAIHIYDGKVYDKFSHWFICCFIMRLNKKEFYLGNIYMSVEENGYSPSTYSTSLEKYHFGQFLTHENPKIRNKARQIQNKESPDFERRRSWWEK